MLLAIALIATSLVLRLAGVMVFRVLCGSYWPLLFDPIPGNDATTGASPPLFPGLSPADFDELIKTRRTTLRLLPPTVARLVWWRLGLRNWSRAVFWVGVILILAEQLA